MCLLFGALVLFMYQGNKEKPGKLQTHLVPHVLVEITLGPAGRWAKCYGAVRLDKFLGVNRASRVCIRRSADVVFPPTETFLLRQRLALQGVFADSTLPSPMAAKEDDEDNWATHVDEREELDDDAVPLMGDGSWGENAQCFETQPITTEEFMAIQPDDDGVQAEVVDEERPPVLDPVLAEQIASAKELHDEVASVDKALPTAWRIDSFDRGARGIRHVSVPPWSRRPPTIEPEVWLGIGEPARRNYINEWKINDPSSFQTQQRCRQLWRAAKDGGTVPRTMIVYARPNDICATHANWRAQCRLEAQTGSSQEALWETVSSDEVHDRSSCAQAKGSTAGPIPYYGTPAATCFEVGNANGMTHSTVRAGSPGLDVGATAQTVHPTTPTGSPGSDGGGGFEVGNATEMTHSTVHAGSPGLNVCVAAQTVHPTKPA